MPTPSVASVVTSATTFAAVSSAFGSRRMMAIPTAGKKIASVSAHSWNQFISVLPTEDHEGHLDGHERQLKITSSRASSPTEAKRMSAYRCTRPDWT